MRIILTISSFLFSTVIHAQVVMMIGKAPVPSPSAAPVTYLDSANFAFTGASGTNLTNHTMLKGNPNGAVFTGTGAYGIKVSSISTARWNSGLSGGSDNGGEPGALNLGYWFSQAALGTIADSNLTIFGLVPGGVYLLSFFASRAASQVGASQRYVSYIIRDAVGDTTISDYNVKGNTTTRVSGGYRVADSNGAIYIRCNPRTPTDATHPFAYIGILTVKRFPR
jgi:hypothetical protein